jgi:hypothetical protein
MIVPSLDHDGHDLHHIFKELGFHCFISFTSCLAPLKKIYFVHYSVNLEKRRCVCKVLEGVDRHINSNQESMHALTFYIDFFDFDWVSSGRRHGKWKVNLLRYYFTYYMSRSWLEFKNIRKFCKINSTRVKLVWVRLTQTRIDSEFIYETEFFYVDLLIHGLDLYTKDFLTTLYQLVLNL